MALAALVIAVIVCFIAWTLWTTYFSPKARLLQKIPGEPALPLLGHTHILPTGANEFYSKVKELCEKYQDVGITKLHLGPLHTMFILFKAPLVEPILNSSRHITKASDYEKLHPWLRTGLLTSTGPKWKSRRRLLTPSFHFQILKDFLLVFNEQVAVMLDKLKTNKDVVNGKSFDIFPAITNCALDIICETAMGTHPNAQNNEHSEYVDAVFKISELIHIRQKQPWLWPDFLYYNITPGKQFANCLKTLHNFTDQVINDRRKEYLEQLNDGVTKKRKAFLDMLLSESEKSGLTHEDIREEVDTFMFEGHDTTSAGIGWATHLIGRHANVQEKLQKEMDNIFGDSGREATFDDLSEMKYLESVVKEAQRLYPSVPMFGRQTSEDTKLGDFTIPGGETVMIITQALHRDPQYFPDPHAFKPERFSSENSTGRHPYCYVPFSAGPRNCIGQKFAMMEEKIVLSTLIRNFSIKSETETEDMCPAGELILRPGNGVLVTLTERA